MSVRWLPVIAIGAALGGCGGPVDLTCDEVLTYASAREGRHIDAPDGLDDLDPLKELPVPRASPRPERPAGSPCLDLPPTVRIGE